MAPVPFSRLVTEREGARVHRPGSAGRSLARKGVARKLVILARETGLKRSLDAVKLENLVTGWSCCYPGGPSSCRGWVGLDAPIGPSMAPAAGCKSQVVSRYVAKLQARWEGAESR